MTRIQHPVEIHGVQEILDEGLDVKDLSTKELLTLVLVELKIMNTHLYSITDEHINKGDL